MSKIPFSTIAVSTEVFPDFVTPVTIEGPGLTTTFDDVSGNVISVDYEKFAETITSSTITNALATKQYVDNNFWTNLTLAEDTNCYCTTFDKPLSFGNYKLRFTFGRMLISPDNYDFSGKALFRLSYTKNENAPFGLTITPVYVYINGTQQTNITIPANYWNTAANTINTVELDISFTNTSANVITTLNGNTITSNNTPYIATITSTNNAECNFRYFAIPGDTSSGSFIENSTSVSSMSVELHNLVFNNTNQVISGQKAFTQDVIIPATAPTTSATAAVTKFYVDTNIAMLIENINTTASNVLALDAYVDNVSSYTSTINERLNTVSGDVATLITFRDWPDDE